ncbi:prenyltransferase/squalene oxidase repeat-containing protein [Spirosoma humi]
MATSVFLLTRRSSRLLLWLLGMGLLCLATRLNAQVVSPRALYAEVLLDMTKALVERQNKHSGHPDHGGIWCADGKLYHTRAAEAMYPFAVAYTITQQKVYLQAAIRAGNWLIRQQQPDGSWKETPEAWTGTTTDQLLMMLLTYPYVQSSLREAEKKNWQSAMRKAADYLNRVMSPRFASINYVATTSATLAKAGIFFNEPAYLTKARQLAHLTVAKMDEDGFINGEGGRSFGQKMGVDLGYDMEMSLWGLGYYARLTKDDVVNEAVQLALKKHLNFMYPDGSMDGSWGIRSNKWTTYGSATSDGCVALFAMHADEDPAYSTASLLNLRYIQSCTRQGILGYGPQHAEIFGREMCIYPTFTKAKNIAFAWELDSASHRTLAPLPTQLTGWTHYYPTLNIAQVRTKLWMATITGYNYKDYAARSKSKYMHRPAGGVISNLWVQDYGFLQASSQTVYSRPEPMSFPDAPDLLPLTPRIEYTDSSGYFTNLYNFDCQLTVDTSQRATPRISVRGELCEKDWMAGSVSYHMTYQFTDTSLTKTIQLRYHDGQPVINIIEPFIQYPDARFVQTDSNTVLITAKNKRFEFKVHSANTLITLGTNADRYGWPYPALKAYPITLTVQPPTSGWSTTVEYQVRLLP